MKLATMMSRWILSACGALIAVLLCGNRRSLIEGIRYLQQLWTWNPTDVTALRRDGRFGLCYELIHATNAERYQIVEDTLRRVGLQPEIIPVPGEALPNILIRLSNEGPYTVFAAHYDKSRETPVYQGACDNTAAVCALLAAAHDLAHTTPSQPVALLFTAAEERGMLGAKAFVDWVRQAEFPIATIINFDMIGRGKLATRPSALPGIYFWLPFIGELAFDGRVFRRGTSYPLPDPTFIQELRTILDGNLVEYQRFTARSDSNIYQDAGMRTVSISSADMAYLDRIWERDTDRIELLDEANLQLAADLIVALSNRVAERYTASPSHVAQK
jgi:hypothetical protein